METKPFKLGDVMFLEGQPSDYVIFVARGEVEVSTQVDGSPVVLGAVGEGQFLGEMAAIEGRAHSATAKAASDGAAVVIDVHSFLGDVSRQPALAHELIRRLSLRLREADRVIAGYRAGGGPEGKTSGAPERAHAGAEITLRAATPTLSFRIGEDAIAVTHLPFLVGRSPEPGEHPARHALELTIRDHPPLRLSREHFVIERQHGRLWVRDLSSKLGTRVNGQPIGRDFPADAAALPPGESRIVAGGDDSPFQFMISVAEASGAA